MTENWQEAGFGLYVHWPFCQAKCPYCDFNSHVAQSVDQARWARALVSRVRQVGEALPGRVLNSIFFGGGTPSLMHPDTVEAVLRAARDAWAWANDIEITLEANPTSVDAARFAGYAGVGVNRVSLGVQALRDKDLQALGRLHNVREALAAIDLARSHFDRVSFDLIYARQNQGLADWRQELIQALDLGVDHLSLYQLTVEPGTAFWDRQARGGLKGLPEEDLAADMFELTTELCEAAGLVGYEVSNHARPGAESRHNLIYWRYGDWVGVGPGAHGRTSQGGRRYASEEYKQPGRWLAAVESGDASGLESVISPQDAVGEHIMMGLRVAEGLNLDRVVRSHLSVRLLEAAGPLIDQGLMWYRDGRLGVTASGRLVLNSVVSHLLPD